MERCHACGVPLETSVLPEHVEDLGGMTVKLCNTVLVHRCPQCGEELIEIPNAQRVYQAATLLRVMMPVPLTEKEVRFLRILFDMKLTEFEEITASTGMKIDLGQAF